MLVGVLSTFGTLCIWEYVVIFACIVLKTWLHNSALIAASMCCSCAACGSQDGASSCVYINSLYTLDDAASLHYMEHQLYINARTPQTMQLTLSL
jgi:hypothetical protein